MQMADSSFLDAKQQLENEMMDRQKRLINIRTGRSRYQSPASEEQLLENEIEDRKIAIEKLGHCRCDSCGTRTEVHEMLRIHMTKYGEKLPIINLLMEKIRITAECSNCQRKCEPQHRSERTVATKDEIVRAFEMLTPAEMRKLQTFADWRVRGLGRAGLGRTGEDLFHDALVSTFTGAKHWCKTNVDFFGHLKFAIRRISFGWKQKFREWEPCLESDIITCNAEGDEVSPLDNVASGSLAADQCIGAKEEVGRILRRFANDKEASAVLQARLDGITTAREIMQEHRLTKRHYESAVKRLRSQKSALVIEEHDQLLELLARLLKAMDFAVVTAGVGDEGLRLYRECSPFDVVIICHSPKLNGVELATSIRKKSPSQRIVITTTYCSEEDIVRPSDLADIPILFKPFSRNELRTALGSSVDTVREKPANCFRRRRRSKTTTNLSMPLRDATLSKLPTSGRTLNATPTS